MKGSARALAAVAAVTLPTHVLLILSGGMAALVLLVYLGMALPAVWSARPARRKAAADVLRQVLNTCTGGKAYEGQPNSGTVNMRSNYPYQGNQLVVGPLVSAAEFGNGRADS